MRGMWHVCAKTNESRSMRKGKEAMKRCVNCNQLEEDDCRFCSRCGGQSFEVAVPSAEKATKKNAVSGGKKALAVTLCLFMSVIAVVASVVLLLRASVSEKTIESAMGRVFEEDELADVKIGELVDAKDEDTTVAEYVYSMLDAQTQAQINEKDIEKLLNEKFVQDFVTEKMNDYLSDALYDDGRGKIKTDEIMELLEDNSKKIEKLTGIPMTARNLADIRETIEESHVLKEMKLSAYTKDYDSAFSALRLFFSDGLRVLLIVLGCLLLAGVFLVLPDRVKACHYVGVAFIAAGCMNILMVVASFALPGIVDNVLPLGEGVYRKIFASMRLHSVIQTVAVTAVGVIFVLIAKCCRRKRRSKTA